MRHDAVIVGGSFAGLSAAMQLVRGNRSVAVLDTGKPRNRFAAASHGFFGQDGAAPLDMIARARAMVAAYPTASIIDQEAVAAEPDGEGFGIALAGGGRIGARKLVLAHGIADGLPEIPGVPERWGHTVLHCPYCHGIEFLGRPLGVLSVMPPSAHQAMLITEWGATTFFLNGGPMPDEAVRAELARRGVAIEPAPVAGLEGEAPELAGVRLADGRLVEIAALYLAPRTRLAAPLAEQLGCAIEAGPFGPLIRTDEMKRTSVPGVYACGDIARAMHNATFASADGVMAGAAVHRELVFGPF